MTLTHVGEQWLDAWMQENALVCWMEHPDPYAMEKEILQALSLPLNLQDNQAHPFWAELSDLRKEAKRSARGSRLQMKQASREATTSPESLRGTQPHSAIHPPISPHGERNL